MSTIIIIICFVIVISLAFMIGVGVQYGHVSQQNSYIKYLEKKVEKAETDLHFAQQEVLIIKDVLKKMEPEAEISDDAPGSSFVTKDDVQKQLTYIHNKLREAGWSSFFFAAEVEFGEAKNIPKIKEVAYTEESYDYEYRHVIGAIILETINNSKLGIFHDSPTKRFK